MLERGHGDFVSYASGAGLTPSLLMGAYASSKAAVVAYTEILHQENLQSGIRFICVCPPLVRTPMVDPSRQAVLPKAVKEAKDVMTPEQVVEIVENDLEQGKFWSLIGLQIKLGWFLRRLSCRLMWRAVHKLEGW